MTKAGFICVALGAMLADGNSLIVPTTVMVIGLTLMVIGARKESR